MSTDNEIKAINKEVKLIKETVVRLDECLLGKKGLVAEVNRFLDSHAEKHKEINSNLKEKVSKWAFNVVITIVGITNVATLTKNIFAENEFKKWRSFMEEQVTIQKDMIVSNKIYSEYYTLASLDKKFKLTEEDRQRLKSLGTYLDLLTINIEKNIEKNKKTR